MAALPMPGWKGAHGPAYFPFPILQKLLILIALLTEIGAHQHDKSTPRRPGEFGQNPPNEARRDMGVTRPFSFGFIFP